MAKQTKPKAAKTPAELADELSAELDAAIPDNPAPAPAPEVDASAEFDPDASAELPDAPRRMPRELQLMARTFDAFTAALHRRNLETALAAELVKGINPRDAAAAAELHKRVQVVAQPFLVSWELEDRTAAAALAAELANL